MNQKITKAEWQHKSRRDFLAAGVLGALGLVGAGWLLGSRENNGIPWPLRKAHEWNEAVWRKVYNNDHLGEVPPAPPVGTPSRTNGDIGLSDRVDTGPWKLQVSPAQELLHTDDKLNLVLSMDHLRAMPQTETSVLFKCVEGWSEAMSFKGVRFSDFLTAMKLGTRDGLPPNAALSNVYSYVGLETPDAEYYVSLDMESMLHPRTLLATHVNGVPLDDDHGAPLRLLVPVKYGIKNIKRVGRIFFADARPRDYWEEQGYDWYASL